GGGRPGGEDVDHHALPAVRGDVDVAAVERGQGEGDRTRRQGRRRRVRRGRRATAGRARERERERQPHDAASRIDQASSGGVTRVVAITTSTIAAYALSPITGCPARVNAWP